MTLETYRKQIRANTLISETTLIPRLLPQADIGNAARSRAQEAAADFIESARTNAGRSGLIDKFLQEYGLSTSEGVTLMRLAEALLRTPDVATADALIRDKVEAGDWSTHRGKSPFPLVNFSTNALMLTAAWLDEVEGDAPARKMMKATKGLLDRVGEPVIRASVAQAMKIMGEHFVLGETIDDAMKRGKSFAKKGYLFSFDMLGEAALTNDAAEEYFKDYQEAIASITPHCTHDNVALNPGISVKLSALHPRYEYNKKSRVMSELGDKLRQLAISAKDANMGFNIDAEEADRLDISLDLIEMMMRDPALDGWDGFGVVVQAYQRRAGFVLDWLAALAKETDRRIMVRLVKGAYWDTEIKRAQSMGLSSYPVFTRKVSTDLNYLACAQKLFDHIDVFYPQFATHNALTATSVREMAQNIHKEPYTDYELQRLHGMGEFLHDTMMEDGVRSRIYAPVGGHKELLPYLVRRLLENGANSSFVNQLIDPDLSIEDIVASPFVEMQAIDIYENPAIPNPRDLYREEFKKSPRLGAKGIDITDPDTASRLSALANQNHPLINAHPLPKKVNILRPASFFTPADGVKNPANHQETIGTVKQSSSKEVNAAIKAARKAQPKWATTAASQRANLLNKTADMLEERMDFFMGLCVKEAGKTWLDADAEVREAVDFCRYYAGQANNTPLSPPLGLIVCISPWNFPLAIFLGQVTAALAAGNCVLAKPAEQTPLIAFEAIKLLHNAGVPKGVLHYLPGDGETIGHNLVSHHDINGVIFTGSTQVANIINRTLSQKNNPDTVLIAETGGMNAMIIDSTALLEQAVNDVISSAFQSAGQRCSACRIVCVQSDIADQFNQMLAGAMAELAMGDPGLLKSDIGPVIDKQAQTNISDHLAMMEKEAKIIAKTPANKTNNATFVAPIAFELKDIASLKQEIFGPVLHMVRYEAHELKSLVQTINNLGYGLTMGIHTRIDETMHTIFKNARIGNIYVNRNQIGAVVGVQPFGGERASGTGPKAGGPHYIHTLTQSTPNAIDEKHEKGNTQNPFPARPLNTAEEKALASANQAFHDWSMEAAEQIFSSTKYPHPMIDDIAKYYEELFSTVHILPGTTGESNTLRLRGRGTIVCLGSSLGVSSHSDLETTSDSPAQDFDILHQQAILALAAGNSIIVPPTDTLKEITKTLTKRGAPKNLITFLALDDLSEEFFHALEINAVAFDGPVTSRHHLRRLLSKRDGAIIPLLSTQKEIQFCVERTLTINTTAAGGDVKLLSLES